MLKDIDTKLAVAPGGAVQLGTRPLGYDSETRAPGAAADYITRRRVNDIASGPIATHDVGEAVFIDEAIRDWRPADTREVVGRVQLLEGRTDCAMTPPAAGTRLVNLLVEHSDTQVGLYSFGEAAVAEGVQDWFRDIKYSNWTEDDAIDRRYHHQFDLHDIAVTDTRTPLHLVLQNPAPSNIVYNFHLAPGVEIARVSMLGGRANAVANLPETVPIEVINAAALEDCGTGVTDPRRVEHHITHRRNNGHVSDKDELEIRADWQIKAQAFDAWFARQFGVGSEASRIGLSYAEVTLIGPIWREGEAMGVPYRPFAGAYLVAQTEEHFVVPGLHEWPAAFDEEVFKLGRQLAGGDPTEILRPAHYVGRY